VIRTGYGHPFVNLEPYVDLAELESLDREICAGLATIPVDYTGGSHKWMGIVPPSLVDEPYADYGQVIAKMDREEFTRFAALADAPWELDPDRRDEYEFGEEREWPWKQALGGAQAVARTLCLGQ
jgi:hypothetical protein